VRARSRARHDPGTLCNPQRPTPKRRNFSIGIIYQLLSRASQSSTDGHRPMLNRPSAGCSWFLEHPSGIGSDLVRKCKILIPAASKGNATMLEHGTKLHRSTSFPLQMSIAPLLLSRAGLLRALHCLSRLILLRSQDSVIGAHSQTSIVYPAIS
jgi:hypothetical protein